MPARVPGTAAGALRDAGWSPATSTPRTGGSGRPSRPRPPSPDEEVVLCLGGLATLADVFLNGELVLQSESMFATHSIDVGDRLRGHNELAIRFRALQPELGVQRRPRARWRTRLVSDNNLRWFRTMLLGRIPSFSPGPRCRRPVATGLARTPSVARRRGARAARPTRRRRRHRRRPRAPQGSWATPLEIRGSRGRRTIRDAPTSRCERSATARSLIADGELRIPSAERWWPHTHGVPALHTARLRRRVPVRGDRRGRSRRIPNARARPARSRDRARRPLAARERRPDLRPRRAVDAAGHRGLERGRRRSCARRSRPSWRPA